jgi:D-alanine transaminase
VFIVSKGVVKTPPKSNELLPGITRDLVVELLAAQAIPCQETTVPEAELRRAEEIWLTSSIREILPVITLDGVPVGTGQAGPLCRRVIALYQAFKRNTTE